MSKLPCPSPADDLRAKALRLEALGAHEHAEPLFAQRLSLVESACGPDDPDGAEALNDLARCRFNGGRLLAALQDYRRLLCLLGDDADDPRTAHTRYQIQRCIEDLRHRTASAALQAPLAILIRRARSQRAIGESSHQERLRSVARKLTARGRLERGARLLQRWVLDLVEAGQSIDDDVLSDLRDRAIGLQNAGHAALATPILRDLVRVQQNRPNGEPGAVAAALEDWGACLAVAGQDLSARETLALADSLARTPGERKPMNLRWAHGSGGDVH